MLKSHRIQFWVLSVLYVGTSLFFLLRQNLYGNPRAAQLAMQVMDLEWIKQAFFESLVFNHYQPPLFGNILLGLLYKFVPGMLLPVYFALSLCLSFAAFACFLKLQQRLGIAWWGIWGASLLIILYPARLEFESMIFYTAPSMALLTAAMFCFYRFFEAEGTRDLFYGTASVVLLTLMNSFFNFLWAIILFTVVFLMTPKRKNLPILVLGCLLVLVIPVKNQIVFGFLGSTSSSGIVFIQRVAVPNVLRQDLAEKGVVSPTAYANNYAPSTFMRPSDSIPDKFRGIPSLTKPFKEFGDRKNHYTTFNYNYYPVIAVTREMARDAWLLYMHYPRFYWKQTLWQFVEFFSGKGTVWDPVIPWFKANILQTPMSLRGTLYVAGMIAAILLWTARRRRLGRAENRIIIFVLVNVAYAVFAGVFVAIFDGPRYRLPFEFYFLLLTVWAVNQLCLRNKVTE